MRRLSLLIWISYNLQCFSYVGLTIERLSEVLAQQEGPRSVESFLEWVSKNSPEQLLRYTLIRTSLSAQEATPLNPRAIVYGLDAKFIFTFNGSPSLKGYHQVELIHYNESSPNQGKGSHFEFREIQFDPTGVGPARLSEANPVKCMQCHYQPMRPIWEPYETWPGAYGKFDDSLIDFKHEKYAPLGKSDEMIKERQEEFDSYQIFRKLAPSHPRYRWLPVATESEADAAISPYAPSEKHSNYNRRPNLKLTELLAELQAKQLVATLKANKDFYPKLAFLLEFQLLNCDFPISSSFTETETQQKIEKFVALLETQLEAYAPQRAWNRTGYSNADSKIGIILSAFGIEFTNFNLSREPDYWNYFAGEYYLYEYLSKALYTELSQKFLELPAFTHRTVYNRTEEYPGTPSSYGEPAKSLQDACRSLVTRYDAYPEAPKYSISVATPVSLCLSCHGNAGPGPRIPFENREALFANSEWVKQIQLRVHSKDPKQRMPPNRALGAKEQAALEDYLRH